MVNVLNFNVNITHDDDTFLCFESSHKSIKTFEWNTLSCSFLKGPCLVLVIE
jgi:hypothetical protein